MDYFWCDIIGVASYETIIYIDPSETNVHVGNTFTINVNLADVTDLYGYDIWLSYNTSFLDVIAVGPPHLLPEPMIEIIEPDGIIHIYKILSSPEQPVSGSGTLASVTFNATAVGSCILDLFDTLLFDPYLSPIPHTVSDGSVTVFSSSQERWAIIEDFNGDQLKVETTSDEVWSMLVQLYYNGSERWIGGIVEEYANEWGFRFDPNTIIVEVSVIEVWQTTIEGISQNLDYWLGEMACVWAKVIEINPETTIHVDPPLTEVYVGNTFVIDVNVTDVFDLYAFEFYLGYNTTFLDALDVVIPSPWVDGYEINNTGGYVRVWAFVSVGTPISGSGTLASIIFNATAEGGGILDLYDTNLIDSMGIPISHNIIDGSVVVSPLIHDVAVISLIASPKKVSPGELISINVTVENQGDYTETFNVSVFYTRILDPLIGTQEVTVAAGDNTTLTFEWTPNTTGRYEIRAEASEVAGEVDTTDNTRTTIVYVGYGTGNSHSESANGYHVVAFLFTLLAAGMIIPEFRKNKKRPQLDISVTVLRHNMPNNVPNMWSDQIRRQPI